MIKKLKHLKVTKYRKINVCDCSDWDENIDKILDPQVFLFLTKGVEYDGKHFKFCPWCGQALK